ncbi:hypothetical protein [Luteitalea sp.]|uniref:hypothetical protein n=1 Tax=Luteitalea sp. TaxID=2004800 RepID=UPI0025B800AF|nr:hypothetical protein [Luteitalea sp.]
MAKALNPVEDASARERRRIGKALSRAIGVLDLDDKEVCALLGTTEKPLDKAQLSRWRSGDENVVLARVYGTRLHGPFAIEMARDAQGCTVETTVVYRAVSA